MNPLSLRDRDRQPREKSRDIGNPRIIRRESALVGAAEGII